MTIGVVKMELMPATTHSAARTPARIYAGVSAVARVAARRQRLIDAALELYGTDGFLATGVKDVCRQAGLTDRYFYESFSNGGELFIAVFDRIATELLHLVAQRVSEAAPQPEAQARAALETFVRALADDPRKARVLFVETAAAGAAVERHVRASVRQFAGLIAATARPYLPEAVPDVVVHMGALSLVGAIEQVLAEWQDGHLDATIDQIIDYLVDVFLVARSGATGWADVTA